MKIHLLFIPIIVMSSTLSVAEEKNEKWAPHQNVLGQISPAFDDQWKRIEAEQQSIRKLIKSSSPANEKEMKALQKQILVKREFRDAMIETYFDELKKATFSSMDEEFGIIPRHEMKQD